MMNYLFIGLIFTFIVDWTNASNKELYLNNRIDWKQRILTILFWPLWLVVIIYHFIKTIINK
jgi:hypothetical protein